MNHQKLTNLLKEYGPISATDKQNIEKFFIPIQVKKKQILIEKNSPCNKLFFINSGILRAYYINNKGREITRMFAWEGRFLTNIGSFRALSENNEIIECVKCANILSINRDDFEKLMKSSLHLKCVYADLLEKYNILHIKRFEALKTFDMEMKLANLKNDFPHLITELNDSLLASFLGISRIHFVNNKHLLYK